MGLGDFLRFRHFITTGFIMIVYILGAILITIGSILLMVSGFAFPTIPGYEQFQMSGAVWVVMGILILIFGNLAWRILCEYLVVQFRIYEALHSIDHKTAPAMAAPPAPAAAQAAPTCPTCGRPLTWVAQYNRWYCQNERKYV